MNRGASIQLKTPGEIEPFSLTLTLSRWEREQPLDNLVKIERNRAEVCVKFTKMRRTFLPLRVGGVGGADGERAGVRCSFHHLWVQGEEETFKREQPFQMGRDA